MSILDTIKKRRSIKEFQKREIPEEVIDKLIEALIWAPSAGNLQSLKDKTLSRIAIHSAKEGFIVPRAKKPSFQAEAGFPRAQGLE